MIQQEQPGWAVACPRDDDGRAMDAAPRAAKATSGWQPPIPAGAMVAARQLGAGLALLGYCYDRVGRDGQLTLNLHTVAEVCGVSVMTARRWWAAMQERGIVVDVRIRGRAGVSGRMHADWLDWRYREARAPQLAPASMPQAAHPKTHPAMSAFPASPATETRTAMNAIPETHTGMNANAAEGERDTYLHAIPETRTGMNAQAAPSAGAAHAETRSSVSMHKEIMIHGNHHLSVVGEEHDHAAHARTPPPAPHPCGDGHDDHHPPAADPSGPLRPAPRFGTKNRFPRSFRASWEENMHEEEHITVQTPHGQAQEPAPRPTDADIAAPVGRPDAARPWASRPPLASGGHNEDVPTTADLPRAGDPTPRPAAARPWASRPPWGAAGQNNDARTDGPRAAQAAPSERARPAVEAQGPQDAHAAPPSAPRVSPAAAAQAAPEDHLPSGLSIPAHGVPSERARLVAATRAAQAAPSAHRASPAPATQAAPADQPPSGPSSLTQGTSSGRIRPAHGSAASGQAAQAASAEQPPSGPHTPAHGMPSTRARPAAVTQATPRDDAGAAPPERQRSLAVAQFYAVFPQARLSAAQEDEITAGVADRHIGLWTRVVREWRDQRYNPHSTTKILHLFSKEERREAAERAREAGRDHGGGPAALGGRTGDPSTWPLGERERRTLERIRAELAVRGV